MVLCIVTASPSLTISPSLKHSTMLGLACGVGAAFCWALGFVVARQGVLAGMSPVLVAMHRFFWPGLVLLPFVAANGFRDLGGLGWGRGFALALVGGLAFMVVAIGLLGIYFTHKVAGPVFKMKKLLKRVGEGHLLFDAKLRKGDELVDFFDAFTQMVSGLREMETNQLADVESAIQALDRGATEDAASALGRVRDSMKVALTK